MAIFMRELVCVRIAQYADTRLNWIERHGWLFLRSFSPDLKPDAIHSITCNTAGTRATPAGRLISPTLRRLRLLIDFLIVVFFYRCYSRPR